MLLHNWVRCQEETAKQLKIVEQLKEFGRTKRGGLGVQITPVSKEIAESLGLPDEKGAFISNINPDGPSKAAGCLLYTSPSPRD